MRITLTVLRCPDHVAPEERAVEGGVFTIGRGLDADWMLPDPSKAMLSRHHCTLAFGSGAWRVTDISKSGTMLNGERLPNNAPSRPLRNGDRLRLGAYEIETAIEVPEQSISNIFRDPPSDGNAPLDGGFGSNSVFGQNLTQVGALEADSLTSTSICLQVGLTAPPLTPPEAPRTQWNHSGPQNDVLRLREPRVTLPPEWNESAAPHVPPPLEPKTPPVQPGADETGLLGAFLEGAGMEDSPPSDPATAMREAGAAFRAFVHGLRRVLMARAEVKSAFRIELTMARSRRNNPLKFATLDEDALCALLGTGRHTDMTASEAVAGVLTDIRLHELATMVAMQEAMQDMLGKLDPARFREAAAGAVLPVLGRARAFELYAAEFRNLREAFTEKFDDAFGRAFGRAYERVVADLQAREPLP